MKKYTIAIVVVILLADINAQACDVCGCGVSNYHYGILPQFRKNFIGLRYRYRSYVSELDDAHSVSHANERFQSTELWGRFYPSRRIQAFVFVPYNFNVRREGDKSTYLQGLGDAVVTATYNLLNTYDSADAAVKHNLLLGGGVKLPTGKFREIENGRTINQNFQLGTGSVDFLASLLYTLRYGNAGLNTEFTYSYNTTNKDEYRFGNTTRTGVAAFYVVSLRNITLMPNAGASLETYEDNKQFGESFSDTGGNAVLLNAGLETYFKSIAVGATYTHPGSQKLFNGKVTSNDRVSVHLTMMF